MSGFIMYVLSGFHNAISNKKMGSSMSKEFKISKRKDLKHNVLYAKRINVEQL